MPSGQDISRFSIATNYIWKDIKTKKKQEAVDFHNVVAWGKLAEIISQYVKKGSKVYIEGRLHNRSWNDKAGTKHYMTEVVAEELIMLGHKTKDSRSESALAKEAPNSTELAVEDDN